MSIPSCIVTGVWRRAQAKSLSANCSSFGRYFLDMRNAYMWFDLFVALPETSSKEAALPVFVSAFERKSACYA